MATFISLSSLFKNSRYDFISFLQVSSLLKVYHLLCPIYELLHLTIDSLLPVGQVLPLPDFALCILSLPINKVFLSLLRKRIDAAIAFRFYYIYGLCTEYKADLFLQCLWQGMFLFQVLQGYVRDFPKDSRRVSLFCICLCIAEGIQDKTAYLHYQKMFSLCCFLCVIWWGYPSAHTLAILGMGIMYTKHSKVVN